ncbi:hypothetical protein TorRG33x02_341140 [Trema orientale]|uniref:Uncharacterized protein n=1 Tax=Trema orientale TaxID=63057 RepID=A0A2P5AUC6_TREOI|nr:hypothetical protein TorRG33x02_341140 [Trema orientale]
MGFLSLRCEIADLYYGLSNSDATNTRFWKIGNTGHPLQFGAENPRGLHTSRVSTQWLMLNVGDGIGAVLGRIFSTYPFD